MTSDFDYVIVGAGLAGSIIARKLAEEHGSRVLIMERRNHIAGNMFDYADCHGIRVQKYGPHVFHTDNPAVYELICRYSEPVPYRTKCEAVIDGVSTPSPFNFRTIDQFWGEGARELKRKLKAYYGERQEVPVMELLNSESEDIRRWANFLFEKDYKPYTAKQWNLPPEEIDPLVLKRVPVVLSYRDTYFADTYEWMPRDGFTAFCAKLLEHHGITVRLNEDALDHIRLCEAQKLVYVDDVPAHVIWTGPIDELFGCRYGALPYRSLRFEHKSFQVDSFQSAAIVAHPQAQGYTRVTEYTKMPVQDGHGFTSVAYEYPVPVNAASGRYYPVLTAQSQEMYGKYRQAAAEYTNLTLCGRLAEFRYYNMDQVVIRAIEVTQGLVESNDTEV